MAFSWGPLRKVAKLFNRPKHDKHARQRQHLFPLVPSPPKQPERRAAFTIIDRLIQRTQPTTAKPVLCTHNVTVTTTSVVDIPAPNEASQPIEATYIITGPVTGRTSRPVGEADDSNPALSPISSIPITRSPVEIGVESGIIEISIGDDQINTRDVCMTESSGSADSANASLRRDLTDTPATTDITVSSKDVDQTELRQNSPGQVDGHKASTEEMKHRSPGSNEDEEDEEDDPVDPDVLRADWEPLNAIPEDLYRKTLQQHLREGADILIDQIRYKEGFQGGNSIVGFMEVDNESSTDQYIIKIPSTGTAARWLDSDAYMLRKDSRTMLYIRKHTDVPCPEVVAFDDSLTNTLGAPYIIMRANKGVSSNRIWFDQDEDGDDDIYNAGLPDKDRMRIRVNFLRSLATCMAKLQALEFDSAGTLDFDDDAENPKIGPTYHWKTVSEMAMLNKSDLSTSKCITRIPAHRISKSYFMTALNECWPRREGVTFWINNGRRHILETMLTSAPFSQSKKAGDTKETFVLRHDDLDFQNILCDEEGNVTGIIDWDKCRAAPRCVGFAALPLFLTKDWHPNFSSEDNNHMPWELEEYRNVYACAMLKATGPHGDGKYTINSAVYEAVNAALYGGHNGGSVGNLVHKIIKTLGSTRMFDDKDILSHLGRGWDFGEARINSELRRFIAPQSQIKEIEPWFWVDPDQ